MHDNKVFIPSADLNDYQDMYALVINFLYAVSNALGVNLYDDYALFRFLSLHLSSMAQRIKRKEKVENELREVIRKEYPDVYGAVEDNIDIIEDFFDVRIDDNEIAYIVMHLCADIIRRKSDTKRLDAAVFCPLGVASTELLRAQVKQYFNISVKEVISENHVAEEMPEVDLVISTVAFNKEECPVIVVNPVLTGTDCDKIQTQIFKILREKDQLKKEENGKM